MEITHAPLTDPADVDLLITFVPDPSSPDPRLATLSPGTADAVTRELAHDRIRAGKGDMVFVTGTDSGPHRLLLIGLGPQLDGHDDAVRTAGGHAARHARASRASSIGILVPRSDDANAFVEGFLLGSYKYDRFKSSNASGDQPNVGQPLATLVLIDAADDHELHDIVARAEATNWARDLANTPANHLTPDMLADEAVVLASQHEHLSVSVLDQAQIEREGLGLLAAVGQGSHHEPRLIVLEWNPPADTRPDSERIAFVGKAVTFDTGGISIKPSAGMHDMKLDKSGGCAVIGAMRAIAETNVPRRVLAVIGSAENMPDGRSYKPGDVITAYDGTTIEVTNTDAEGRLVLGDSISWARKLGCGGIVELSTLTGAMVIALGHHFTGLIARSGPLTDAVLAAAERTGDHAWHLPMHDGYKPGLKSECADMVNSGGRAGGSLYAGLFLSHFAKDTPFVHLDIAGTAMLPKPQGPYSVSGASGWGVRMLTDLAASY